MASIEVKQISTSCKTRMRILDDDEIRFTSMNVVFKV